MASMYNSLLCFVLCFFELHLCMNHQAEATNLPKYELEKELKLLNKPSVKTIRTEDGEVYNCVSTRNYSFQPLFTKALHNNIESSSRTYQASLDRLWLNNEKSCPTGTVAIKKITRNDLVRAKLAADIYARKSELFTAEEPGTHYAVVRTSGTFYGAAFSTSVWNPMAIGSQYSSCLMKLQNGQDSIEIGWTVNPSLYNDTRTRVFVYTKAGDKHCFNAYCRLFVPAEGSEVGKFFPITSKRGGDIYEAPYLIYQDQSSGDWVLESGLKAGLRLGHWPKSNFKDLRNSATFIEWGSKVFSPQNIPSPPMGSGESKLREDIHYDAYCRNLQIMNEPNKLISVQNITTYTDTPTYQVRDKGIVTYYGHLMYFGGAGGMTGN